MASDDPWETVHVRRGPRGALTWCGFWIRQLQLSTLQRTVNEEDAVEATCDRCKAEHTAAVLAHPGHPERAWRGP